MKISSLQKARYEYSPKLPGMLRHGISAICVKEGEETQSVADQETIKALFPNTYGKKEITFEKGENTSEAKKQVVGVILSGGQAPGGHNVICGLYDALKATNPENELYGFSQPEFVILGLAGPIVPTDTSNDAMGLKTVDEGGEASDLPFEMSIDWIRLYQEPGKGMFKSK